MSPYSIKRMHIKRMHSQLRKNTLLICKEGVNCKKQRRSKEALISKEAKIFAKSVLLSHKLHFEFFCAIEI